MLVTLLPKCSKAKARHGHCNWNYPEIGSSRLWSSEILPELDKQSQPLELSWPGAERRVWVLCERDAWTSSPTVLQKSKLTPQIKAKVRCRPGPGWNPGRGWPGWLALFEA